MLKKYKVFYFSLIITLLALGLFSCKITYVRKAPHNKHYLYKNSYEVKGGKLNKTETEAMKSRMAIQLDDSSKLNESDRFFILNRLYKPPVFDTSYAAQSARNMQASMLHLGYHRPVATYTADTIGKKVSVKYSIDLGKQTLIDTVTYRLRKPALQALATKDADKRILVKGNPITKAAVLGEVARLVDTFRNNGYYKISSAEIGVRGDTTNELLTTISDDPFEQIRLFQLAQARRDSPKIKLQIVLKNPQDTSKLEPYRIRDIYVLEDYFLGDDFNDTTRFVQRRTRNFILRYHKQLFRTSFLSRNIVFRPGELYRQNDYTQTINNLSKTGVWDNINIHIKDIPGTNLLDIVLELMPSKRYVFEANAEASYSAVSNTNTVISGNLIGLSLNTSLTDRNLWREGIKMTHNLRAGVELNNQVVDNASFINSQEVGYRNNLIIPKLVKPFDKIFRKSYKNAETFANAGISFNKRLDLFSIQNFNLNYGVTLLTKQTATKDRKWSWMPINAEFTYLIESDSFKNVVKPRFPFLNYTYTNSLILGQRLGFVHNYRNPRHLNSLLRERSIKLNMEESGLTWGALPFFSNVKRRYLKLDAEYKYSVNFGKTSYVLRSFVGVGIPVLRSRNDTLITLPFFKQFAAGGANSMRGWPIRGIGRGGEALTPRTDRLFNDRTGDIQVELNAEYRYEIAHIIPNSLILRGAVFADAGNVWNMRKGLKVVGEDVAQFQFKNLYKQMGLSLGTGFRIDYSNIILRADFAFRFKRPETSSINDGWKIPSIGFDDAFKKIFSPKQEYRQWRYENFNFTFGISYPF